MSQRKRLDYSGPNSKQIDDYIAASIDLAIGEMLGETVVDSFYVNLNERGISRKDVRRKIRLFCSLLDETFGLQSAAIQRTIAKKLFDKLGLVFTPDGAKTLKDYVADAKEMLAHVEA
jgi:hypothetical protein